MGIVSHNPVEGAEEPRSLRRDPTRGDATTLLAFDLGTTGAKAVLIDSADGAVLATAFQSYRTVHTPDGGAEQNPDDWWAAVVTCCASLRQQNTAMFDSIAAVGCSGMMNGAVLVKRNGEHVRNAIIHADVRSGPQCGQLVRSLGFDSIYDATQNRIDPHVTLPKLMWLAQHRPEDLRRADKVIQAKDYIRGKLTGVFDATDPSDASLTGGYNVRDRRWVPDIWAAADIPDRLLPDVLPSTAVAGCVTTDASAATALRSGTPVVTGGGDGACASAGSGAGLGEAYNYLGGTSWIGVVRHTPLIEIRLSNYCCLDERVTTYGTVQAAGSSVDWIASLLAPGSAGHSTLDTMASTATAGSAGLFFLPYLQGERAPLWDPSARGVLFGLASHHGAAEVYRSVIEGVCFALRSILDVFAEHGEASGALRILGGGACSTLWRELHGAITGRALSVVAEQSSATSIGAAMAAGVGVGVYATIDDAARLVQVERVILPNADDAHRYDRLYEKWSRLYPAVRELFDDR